MEIDIDLLKVFIDELTDTLAQWEQACLKLETGANKEDIDDLFRIAHNMKGTARTVGLIKLSELIHTIEDVINKLRVNISLFDKTYLSILLESHTLLENWGRQLPQDPTYMPSPHELSALLERLRSVSEAEMTLNEEEAPPKRVGDILIELGKVTQEDVDAAAQLQNAKIGEILVKTGVIKEADVEEALLLQKSDKSKKERATIRVDAEKIDKLIQTITELSIQLSIVYHHKRAKNLINETVFNAIEASHKATRELQQEGISLRMQNVTGLFQRLRRSVMDIARKQNKNVQVVTKGTECELDKNVIEKISGPLTHLVRNAIDHGIESFETRSHLKKDPMANIEMTANYEGNSIVIEIKDDGRGIDQQKVIRKAMEKGLIPPHSTLSEEEIFQLIFKPNFSTADELSEISGRGVGLDVVKTEIESLQGQIEVTSVLNKGTSFKVIIPLSVILIETLIVRLGPVKYLVPIHDVIEITDLRKHEVQTETLGTKYFDFRGEVLPLIDLPQVFLKGKEHKAYLEFKEQNKNRPKPCLILLLDDHKVALEVSDIEGQQQIICRSLSSQISQQEIYKGSTVLSNGQPGLILDLFKSQIVH